MSRIVRNVGWAEISLNTWSSHILCREDWRYNWLTVPPARPWTESEKRHFHNTIDTQIWRFWSNRLPIHVTGTDPFARHFSTVRIEFDVRRVTTGGHWTVQARKLPRGGTFHSETVFSARTISLDTEDLTPLPSINALRAVRLNSYTAPHEFGHTQPDVPVSGRSSFGEMPDEYTPGTPPALLADTDSIMNIGRQLRARHLAAVLAELNTMLPGCTFSA